MKKIAIKRNGFVSEELLKSSFRPHPQWNWLLVNGHSIHENIAYLLKYDFVYVNRKEVKFDENNLIVDGIKIQYNSERNPEIALEKENWYWLVMKVQVFHQKWRAKNHIKAEPICNYSHQQKVKTIPRIVHG